MDMNQPAEIHGYLHLFVVGLVFSFLANLVFIPYSFYRGDLLLEPILVALVIGVVFSVLGQEISKIKKIGRWILIISTFSMFLNYRVFVIPRSLSNIQSEIVVYAYASMFLGFVGWSLSSHILSKVIQKTLTGKRLGLAIGCITLFVLFVIYVTMNLPELMHFFDTHPWAMTLIGVLVSSLISLGGGILVGRRTKE